MAESRLMQGRGTLRVALAFAAFLASLSMVVRRQSTAYALLEKLDGERTKRAMIESERSRLMTEMQRLESRSRIAGVAGRWWGMRSPESDEEFVIILRPDAGAASEAETRVAVARATLGRVRAEWGRD